MEILITVILLLSSVVMVMLVLLHKGRGGGMSDMFGGGVSTGLGGSSVAERNLDRITVGIGLVWTLCVFALGLLGTPLSLLTPVPLKLIVDNVIGDAPLPSWLGAIPSLGPGSEALFALAIALSVALVALGLCHRQVEFALLRRNAELQRLHHIAVLLPADVLLVVVTHDNNVCWLVEDTRY